MSRSSYRLGRTLGTRQGAPARGWRTLRSHRRQCTQRHTPAELPSQPSPGTRRMRRPLCHQWQGSLQLHKSQEAAADRRAWRRLLLEPEVHPAQGDRGPGANLFARRLLHLGIFETIAQSGPAEPDRTAQGTAIPRCATARRALQGRTGAAIDHSPNQRPCGRRPPKAAGIRRHTRSAGSHAVRDRG